MWRWARATSSTAAHAIDNVGLARFVAGIIFPVGLMIIVFVGGELFTGNCLIVMDVVGKKVTWFECIRNLIVVYFSNLIGALIMVHGDDSGLVIPPRIAPVQTMIIPIAQHKEGVLDKANELVDTLKAAGYKVKIDDSDKAPGWKFSGQEILGIPTRIEIGPKDIENNQAVIVRRDTREKIVVSLDELTTKLAEVLETMQNDMFERAKAFLDSHINEATTMDEMNEKFNENLGFIKAMWCGDEACEDEIKAQTGGATSRCIPEEEEHLSDVCVCCGKPAKHMVYWGKAY